MFYPADIGEQLGDGFVVGETVVGLIASKFVSNGLFDADRRAVLAHDASENGLATYIG